MCEYVQADRWRCLQLAASEGVDDAQLQLDQHDEDLLHSLLTVLDIVSECLRESRDNALDVCSLKLAELEEIAKNIRRRREEGCVTSYHVTPHLVLSRHVTSRRVAHHCVRVEFASIGEREEILRLAAFLFLLQCHHLFFGQKGKKGELAILRIYDAVATRTFFVL
jgi:hypothetical protein